jgi:hypothetical protein
MAMAKNTVINKTGIKKPTTAKDKLLGPNGTKVKYFEAKVKAEKYPKDATAKRQLTDRARTNSRANFIVNREMAKKSATKKSK